MRYGQSDSVVNLSNDKLLEQYADYEIKCRHHHLSRSGMDLQRSVIKIDKYELNFVPYSLSLSKCRFLTAMSTQEMDHFNTLIEGTCSIRMAFESEIWSRRVEFLLWGHIDRIGRANPALSIALITFTISRVANTYREIFIDMALDNDQLTALYEDEERSNVVFDNGCFGDVFGSNTVTLMPGTKLERPFDVRSFSLRSMVLVGPVPPDREILDALVKIVMVEDRPPLIVEGTIIAEERSVESDAFRIITLKLEYSPDLAEIMSPFLQSSE